MNFKSKLEKEVYELLKLPYEGVSYKYTEEHEYIPDFIEGKGKVIEVKGRFRTSKEAAKYVWIRKSNPKLSIKFIFYDKNTPMPGARIRKKCGTRYTVGEWAEKNGFEYTTIGDLRNVRKE